MSEAAAHWGFLRALTWGHVLLVAAVVAGCGVLIALVRGLVRRAAEEAPSRHRLVILRYAPIARLVITLAGLMIIVPILVEPTFDDIVALIATVGLALAFALKDYISCLVAGIVTIVENTYQPGDWIEFDGAYGEVKTIGTRAVHIVTADDTEVIIPHAKIWSTSVSNDSSGSHTLLTVTHFYLDADHDGAAVSQALAEIAGASPHLKPRSSVKVTVAETPFGTHYKLKAYVAESRDQFAMITDLTLRAKERPRAMGVAFARAPYAQTGK
jgi:small-conductance mechanosensitive channel